MFVRIARHFETRQGWRAGATALGLGVSGALALPPLHLVPLLLLALPGLMALVASRATAGAAFAAGFWWGVGYHLAGLYWITEAILIEAARFWWLVPVAVPALAAVLALFIAVPALLAWRAPAGWPRILCFAGAFVLGEMARGVVLTGFPWNPLGSVWAFGALFLQPAAWVGVSGLSLLTLLVTLAPLAGRAGMAAAGAGLVLWAAAGLARLWPMEPPPQAVRLVIVQGNIPQDRKWDRDALAGHFRRYLELTARGVREAGPEAVVIWPETASPYQPDRDALARRMIAAAADGRPVLLGAIRFDTAGRPHNSLLALAGDGPPVAIYDKAHLVPFGEFQPSWARVGVQLVPGDGFAPGPGPVTLRVQGLPPFGPSICYEAIFPGAVADEADRPAWLVNITNDAWFGASAGPWQHLAAARLRAVEEGLPLARAANTGISAVFDARGRTVARLGIDRTGVLVAPLPAALPSTPFSRFGGWLPGMLAAVLAVSGVLRIKSYKSSKIH